VAEFTTSFVVYLCVMGGALIGTYLRRVLPSEHVKDNTRQIVNVAIGLIATLAALVLGLMIASAKNSFDIRSEEVRESAARLIVLDRSLRQYGPETRESAICCGK
jgi:fluoride ion exporter CrcB/FEX